MSDFYCDEVLNGKTPVNKVYEDDLVLAYHHTRPFYERHIVVIPKQHIPSLLSLTEADDELLLRILTVSRQIAADMVAEYGAARLTTNMGEYQDSKHLHFHVVYGKRTGANAQ